jgi:DNA-binding NtrC family response regulator
MTESGGSRTPLATTGEIAEAIADPEFGPWLAQASILVVDDEPGVRNFLVRILKPRCKRIEEASDAKEASRKLDEQHFDLVILDNLMPRKSGLDWLAALRVVVVDFVLKPFRSNQLLNAVARCLDRTRLQRENDVLRHELRSQSGPFADLSG